MSWSLRPRKTSDSVEERRDKNSYLACVMVSNAGRFDFSEIGIYDSDHVRQPFVRPDVETYRARLSWAQHYIIDKFYFDK